MNMYWRHGGLNGDDYYPSDGYPDEYPSFGGGSKNRLFYHNKIEYLSIKHETEKAYLFEYREGLEIWVAKSLCRDLDVVNNTVYIHRFYHKLRVRVDEIVAAI
jgi:hypothetical protein